MSDIQPLIALGHAIGIEREFCEADSDLVRRILAEAAHLRETERSTRRKRRLSWALRAALAAVGIGLVGF